MSFPIDGSDNIRIRENIKNPDGSSIQVNENDSDISIFLSQLENADTESLVDLFSQDNGVINKIFSLFSSSDSNEISNKITDVLGNLFENFDTDSIDTESLSNAMVKFGDILNSAGINPKSINSSVVESATNGLFDDYAQNSNISGTIDVQGKEIDSSKLADAFMGTLCETANASGEILGSLISNSVDVSNGTKTKEQASKGFLESCIDFFKGIGDSLKTFLDESGLSDSIEKMKDLYKNNIKTFLGSFLKNAVKTLITNPASIADPVAFLTQTLVSTVSDKSFQAGMAKNFAEFLGTDTNSEEYQQILNIAQMALQASQSS